VCTGVGHVTDSTLLNAQPNCWSPTAHIPYKSFKISLFYSFDAIPSQVIPHTFQDQKQKQQRQEQEQKQKQQKGIKKNRRVTEKKSNQSIHGRTMKKGQTNSTKRGRGGATNKFVQFARDYRFDFRLKGRERR
jgi:hypothetical protein